MVISAAERLLSNGTWEQIWGPGSLISSSTAPAVIHTSVEARRDGLKHYKLEYRASLIEHSRGSDRIELPHVYVNLDVDRICLSQSLSYPAVCRLLRWQVKSMAINPTYRTCGNRARTIDVFEFAIRSWIQSNVKENFLCHEDFPLSGTFQFDEDLGYIDGMAIPWTKIGARKYCERESPTSIESTAVRYGLVLGISCCRELSPGHENQRARRRLMVFILPQCRAI